jgi:hypothetical protein
VDEDRLFANEECVESSNGQIRHWQQWFIPLFDSTYSCRRPIVKMDRISSSQLMGIHPTTTKSFPFVFARIQFSRNGSFVEIAAFNNPKWVVRSRLNPRTVELSRFITYSDGKDSVV